MEQYGKELTDALRDFPELWARVTGKHPPENGNFWQELINGEHCTAQYYSTLSHMFQSKGRNELLSRAADAKKRERRLRAEYFISTGLTLAVPDNCPAVSGKLASLRSVMKREHTAAEQYKNAADNAPSPELQALFLRFSAEADAAAHADRAMLIECF